LVSYPDIRKIKKIGDWRVLLLLNIVHCESNLPLLFEIGRNYEARKLELEKKPKRIHKTFPKQNASQNNSQA